MSDDTARSEAHETALTRMQRALDVNDLVLADRFLIDYLKATGAEDIAALAQEVAERRIMRKDGPRA